MQKSSLVTFVLVAIAIAVSGMQALRVMKDAGYGVVSDTETTAPTPSAPTPPVANEPERPADGPSRSEATLSLPAFLPAEARDTLAAIVRGGPYPYRQDGSVFHNREGNLPVRPRGYYREYTVVTPGSPDRGARRIVSGDDPPSEFFYTDDHYASFRRFVVGAER